MLRLARDTGIPTHERDVSLTDVYGADEAFVTGTFAGVVPVREVDGRTIGDGGSRPDTDRLRTLHRAAIEGERCAATWASTSPRGCWRGHPAPGTPTESGGRYWYDAVWRSTGFARYRPRHPQLQGPAAAVAEECLPMYERLHAARWVL